MKIITFKKIPSRKTKGKMVGAVIDGIPVKSSPWVYPDGYAAEIIQSKWRNHLKSVEDLEPHLNRYHGQDLSGKTILIWRTGGYGDVLFLTPLIRELKKRYPTCKVWFGSREKYHMVFRGNPDPERIFHHIIPIHAVRAADYHLHFEGTIEASRDPNLHAVDLFARHAGIELPANNKLPIYRTSPAQVIARKVEMLDLGAYPDAPWIAIQTHTTSSIRTYPPGLLGQVLRKLARKGYVCFVLGMAGWLPDGCNRRNIVDLTGRYPDMSDVVAVMANCRCLIAPDSSLAHFAAALDIPTVALYGPFPGSVRTKYYPRCITLEAQAPCAPCMIHGHLPCPEAQKIGSEWSPCFDSIAPAEIVQAVREIVPASQAIQKIDKNQSPPLLSRP